MNVLLTGAFAAPIILPLLAAGYLLAYVLASMATNPKANSGILLVGLTLLGWIFITVVIYGLAYMHRSEERVVFVHLIPWYSLWFIYSGAITLGAAHATSRRAVRRALQLVTPLPPLHPPTSASVVAVDPHGPTVLTITPGRTTLESAQDTLDTAQTTLESAQDTVRTARTEQAFVEDHARHDEPATP